MIRKQYECSQCGNGIKCSYVTLIPEDNQEYRQMVGCPAYTHDCKTFTKCRRANWRQISETTIPDDKDLKL